MRPRADQRPHYCLAMLRPRTDDDEGTIRIFLLMCFGWIRWQLLRYGIDEVGNWRRNYR